MPPRDLERRLVAIEAALPSAVADVEHPVTRTLRTAGIDLRVLDNAALDRLERLASSWPRELGNIPWGIISAAAGLDTERRGL